MLRTHLAIVCRAVLEVVAVAVLREPFLLGSHLRRRLYEVVLRTEIVGVVGLVDLTNIIQKGFERLSVAIRIQQGRERLVEFVERFHAREDIVRPLEALAHDIRHLHLLERGIQCAGMGVDELLNLRFCQHLDAELRTVLGIERVHHAVEQFRELLAYLLLLFRQRQGLWSIA